MSLHERTFNVDQNLLRLAPNNRQRVGPLHLGVNWVEATAIVELSGEVAMATVPLLYDYLDELCASLMETLVVDLTLVTFLDSSGLALLLGANKRLREHGGRLIVYAPTLRVRRLLEMSGLTPILEVVPAKAPDATR